MKKVRLTLGEEREVAADTGSQVQEESWKGDDDDKSLYLCFAEHRVDGYFTYAIKAIGLSALSSSLWSGCSLKLRQVAYTSGEDLPRNMGCGVFGSKILLAGGTIGVYDPVVATQEGRYNPKLGGFVPCPCTEIHVFETRNQSLSPFGSFIEGKAKPLLVEVEGKLYALAGYPIQSSINYSGTGYGGPPYFEVLDPIIERWSPLPDPPVFQDYNRTYGPAGPREFCYLVAGSNILCTSENSPSYYRFDVAEPDEGWSALPSSFLSGPLPYNTIGRTFVADGADGEFILFSFSYGEPDSDSDFDSDSECEQPYPHPHILVQLLSSDFGCVTTLNRVMLPTDRIPPLFLTPNNYRLVKLEDARLCLLLSSFDRYNDKLSVFALQFKFTKKIDSLDVQFLASDIFESDTLRPQESETHHVEMLGAVLL
ncbi:unnamed protein product [Prunus armeniaca]|uniref:Uncharacterized protein n=1 Tax=Prunus armeniaca TaxID=36596 RepID=A0A6J5XFC5_PRUAR|nr:unnamed protein product [Prunus armeniaca]